MSATHPRRRWQRLRYAVAGAALALASPALTVTQAAAPAAATTVPVVSAGGGHSCALMPDQSVWCWGQNTTGQLGDGSTADSTVPVQVQGLPPALNVGAGHDHTCAVATTNAVWCWGNNAFGELGNGTTSTSQPLPVQAQGVSALQVSAGYGFTCAVTLAHTVDCWGDNNYGELGDGTSADSSTPVKVKKLTNVTQVAAGYYHACALESRGTVWCWGDNGDGELGQGTTPVTSSTPLQVGIQNATFVAAGFSDSCAIGDAPGDLLCWGANNVGQLGTGDLVEHAVPAQVAGLNSGVSQVGLGEDFGCAIAATPGATALCWGDADGYGQLGDGNFDQDDPFPTVVFGLQAPPAGDPGAPRQIAVGGHHACVVTVPGKVECWGKNLTGALGDGTTLDRAIPTPTIGLPGLAHTAAAVTGGVVTSCAVTASLSAACWGEMTGNNSPLLTVHTSAVPVQLPAGKVSQISAGYGGCAMVRAGGLSISLRCWGDNTWGEIGNGSTTPEKAPAKVTGLPSPVQSVSSAGSHVCALVHNGGAWCWGYNDDGQLGDGTTSNSSTPVAVTGLPLNVAQIAAADDHTCALLINETVMCWGLNGSGQLGDGTTSNSSTPVAVAGLTGVVQIAVGDAYTCALLGSGDVECWGSNSFGELGNGGTASSTSPVQVSGLTTGVEAISGGDASACAVLISNQVDCWGDNTSGELGNGSVGGQSDTPVAVQGGAFASDGASIGLGTFGSTACSLNSGEVPECWGFNTDGEAGDGTTTDTGTPGVVQGL